MKAILTLSCPSCGGQVNISEHSNRFTCEYCGNQHLLQFNVQPAPAQPLRPRVAKPGSMQVLRKSRSARITRRWWSANFIFITIFAAAWDILLIFLYAAVIAGGSPWFATAFPIAFLAVGIASTYYALAGIFNKTIVELTPFQLEVWHEPLPWSGEKVIKTADIKQLFCKEQGNHGNNSTHTVYEVYAITQEDVQIKLISDLDSPDMAQFLEQQLETWLRIPDQPVVGEIAR